MSLRFHGPALVTKPDGSPLPTDASGNFVTEEGIIVEKDDEGKPLGPDGQVLPTDSAGNYIFPIIGPDGSSDLMELLCRQMPAELQSELMENQSQQIQPEDLLEKTVLLFQLTPRATSSTSLRRLKRAKVLPTDESGNVIYPITKPDGSPLPTDASGNFVTEEGIIVEKDDEGKPLGPDGQVLPTDSADNYIFPIIGPDGSVLPTDENKKPVYPVVGPDGTPLPTDASGAAIGVDGKPIPTDSAGRPLGEDGSPLPTDASGNFVNVPSATETSKVLPTDESGNVIYPITKPDGSPLPTDASGNFVTEEGIIVEKDDEGKPLGPDGQVLPTDSADNYIFPIIGPDGSVLPTDENKKPVYPVVGPDGTPLPTDASGAAIGPEDLLEKTVLLFQLTPRATSSTSLRRLKRAKVLPTDESGNVIYPITKPDGSPLPTDASGNFVTEEGIIVEKDDEGKPLGP
ncbi:unnamed protein product [Caenorhabditis auriculariae]|uniref:Uncharacterized protein n=1 Tax=Caenorhabditis auriculariae TaxID=2777116 RepID=A0A8S1GSY0_9PELO|nr:unnamed protein product [Caenorhabditis auriculariae]